MSDSEDLVHKVRRSLSEWDRARQDAYRVREQFAATGGQDEQGSFQNPARVLDAQGLADIQAADDVAEKKWNLHQTALEEWRALRQ